MTGDVCAEEEALLARVRRSLVKRARAAGPGAATDGGSERDAYDDRLVALRDEIGDARLEDVPQLWAEMERLRQFSLTRMDLSSMMVDPASPYFGHLRLREQVRGLGAIERPRPWPHDWSDLRARTWSRSVATASTPRRR